jgi:alkylation response protein AidB-like acyl-CoA dehydrogenase
MRDSHRIAPYFEALRALAPLIAEHRASFDRDRRLPEVVFAALARAGLFRLWLPKSLGGAELSPLEFMDVVEAASALDGTVGWIVGNGGGMSRIGGYLPEKIARAWFSNPSTFCVSATGAVGTAVPVEGGFRVSGRWPFGSGAHYGSHFMGVASVKDAAGNNQPPMCCYFTREQVIVHDTWHVSGLRGTGSCDFEVRDGYIPSAQVHPLLDPVPTDPGVVYRLPPISVFSWTVSVVPLGIARGALDAFAQSASRKTRLGTSAQIRDREIVQSAIGRIDIEHRAARGLLVEAMRELMAAVDAGGDRLLRARALLRAACAHAAETAVSIVDRLTAEAGAGAIYESNPLERAARDVHAAVKHVAMNPSNYIVAGQLALGLPPGPGRF